MSRLPKVNVDGTPFKKVLGNAPDILEAVEQLDKALSNILDPELLELLRLRAAANNACEY